MTISKKKVLIAEDNSALATVLKLNLSRAGFDVAIAKNGEEAWTLYQQEFFDLVMTDHQMPKLSGAELCQRIRSVFPDRKTPLIMLTAKTIELNTEDLKKRFELTGLFSKPFSPTAVVTLVDETLAVSTH